MSESMEPTPDREPPPQADAVLKVYGLRCGVIEPGIRARIKDLESGQVLEVTGQDRRSENTRRSTVQVLRALFTAA